MTILVYCSNIPESVSLKHSFKILFHCSLVSVLTLSWSPLLPVQFPIVSTWPILRRGFSAVPSPSSPRMGERNCIGGDLGIVMSMVVSLQQPQLPSYAGSGNVSSPFWACEFHCRLRKVACFFFSHDGVKSPSKGSVLYKMTDGEIHQPYLSQVDACDCWLELEPSSHFSRLRESFLSTLADVCDWRLRRGKEPP